MDTRLHDTIVALVRPVIETLGLDLWGLEFGASGHRTVLRIYVDAPRDLEAETRAVASQLARESAPAQDRDTDYVWERDEKTSDAPEAAPLVFDQAGVTIDQCAKVSRHIGLTLEVEDVVPGAYTLEVSSPGFERPFFTPAQMGPYAGRELAVTLHNPLGDPFPGRKKLTGVLAAAPDEKGAFTLAVEGHDITISWQDVKKARLVHRFDDENKKKPGK
ncbi:MAG: ribosome maturation factor RimP [Desulfovibrionaceae bacterium]